MRALKYAVMVGMGLFAAGTYGQSMEVPAIPGDNPRTPIVWGSMDAFDLERTNLRTGQPLVTFEAQFREQKERQQRARMDRLRTRVASRLRETGHAGGQPAGDAAVGTGRRGSSPAAGSQ